MLFSRKICLTTKRRNKGVPLAIVKESDEFKGGFFTGQEDRSAAIARTMLSQGWDVPFVAKMVMLDVEVVEVIKSLMEDRRQSEQM